MSAQAARKSSDFRRFAICWTPEASQASIGQWLPVQNAPYLVHNACFPSLDDCFLSLDACFPSLDACF